MRMVFSVGRDSLAGVLVLAVVVDSGQDGVVASTIRDRVGNLGVVLVEAEEVSEILRALERQGFVSRTDVRFCATEKGRERTHAVLRACQHVETG